MKEIIRFIKIPANFKDINIIGKPDTGTRRYRQFGDEKKSVLWWDAILKLTKGDHVLSPGGAASFVGVTRASVHKRIREGRLTAFEFYRIKKSKLLKIINIDYDMLVDSGYPREIYIPWSELKYWRDYTMARKNKKNLMEQTGVSFKN